MINGHTFCMHTHIFAMCHLRKPKMVWTNAIAEVPFIVLWLKWILDGCIHIFNISWKESFIRPYNIQKPLLFQHIFMNNKKKKNLYIVLYAHQSFGHFRNKFDMRWFAFVFHLTNQNNFRFRFAKSANRMRRGFFFLAVSIRREESMTRFYTVCLQFECITAHCTLISS